MRIKTVFFALSCIFILTSIDASVGGSPEHLPRPPIHIRGDGDLTWSNGVVGGSGTQQDPYVISGWFIASAPSSMRIENVSKHLVVRDNLLTTPAGHAIWLERSSNVTIETNEIQASNNGIFVYEASNITVARNTIIGQDIPVIRWPVGGITISSSRQVAVEENVVESFHAGISVQRGSGEVTVRANTVAGGGWFSGISTTTGGNVSIVKNLVTRSLGGGIAVHGEQFDPAEHDVLVEVLDNRVERTHIGIYSGASLGETDPRGLVIKNNVIRNADSSLQIGCRACHVAQNVLRDGGDYGYLIDRTNKSRAEENVLQAHDGGWIYAEGFLYRHNDMFDPPVPTVYARKVQDWRHNWWGTSDGPEDSMIDGPLEVEPWLTQPFSA